MRRFFARLRPSLSIAGVLDGYHQPFGIEGRRRSRCDSDELPSLIVQIATAIRNRSPGQPRLRKALLDPCKRGRLVDLDPACAAVQFAATPINGLAKVSLVAAGGVRDAVYLPARNRASRINSVAASMKLYVIGLIENAVRYGFRCRTPVNACQRTSFKLSKCWTLTVSTH